MQTKIEDSKDSRAIYILSCWEKIPDLFDTQELEKSITETTEFLIKVMEDLADRYCSVALEEQDDELDDLEI